MQAKHNKAISKDTWSQLFEFSRVSWSTYRSLGHHFIISSDGVHTIHIKIYSSSLVLKTRLHPQKSSDVRGFFPMFETRMPDLWFRKLVWIWVALLSSCLINISRAEVTRLGIQKCSNVRGFFKLYKQEWQISRCWSAFGCCCLPLARWTFQELKLYFLPKGKTIVAEVFLKLCAKTKISLPEKVFICSLKEGNLISLSVCCQSR